jgi:xanthine dehydrogenase accessory factor
VREIAAGLRRLLDDGTPFALATIVRVGGSSPRPVGTTMAVSRTGEVVGSLSGGCIEGAVYTAAQETLADGRVRLETYGISDGDAFAVGLTCGGLLEVLVQPVQEADAALLRELLADLATDAPVAWATVVTCEDSAVGLGRHRVVRAADGGASGSLGDPFLDKAVTDDALGLLATGQDGRRGYGPRGERGAADVAVLVQVFAPPPRLIVFGAIDFAAALVRQGRFLGYRVTVCDARAVFATRQRFPDAHEVVVAWPHDYLDVTTVDARTALCVLTHDPKFDVPLLERALRGPAAYVGAMGSRRTHADRLLRLRERGLTGDELARLRGPIGLDLGARTPEETAVSIAAEIVQVRWGATGLPLSATDGAIHRAPVVPPVAVAG